MGRPAKHPHQDFMGVRYYSRDDGYLKAGPRDGGGYLHHAVWVAKHGPIPAGFDVHHVDEDKANCAPSNLEAIPAADHRSMQAVARMADRPRYEATCQQCKKPFMACFSPKFCSDVCRSTARWNSGVDDEQRACAVCSGGFTINKNKAQAHCSVSCAATARWAARRAQVSTRGCHQ